MIIKIIHSDDLCELIIGQAPDGTQYIESNSINFYNSEPLNYGPYMAPIQGPEDLNDDIDF
tara:strand:+ start:38 stop:220 length:183 start_codon:yes stop_codon:yes gene_type:complete